jgi:hypothetical protein
LTELDQLRAENTKLGTENAKLRHVLKPFTAAAKICHRQRWSDNEWIGVVKVRDLMEVAALVAE